MNRLVLTSKYWGIRNTEIIYDFLFFITVFVFSIFSLIGSPTAFLYSLIGLLVLSILILVFLRKSKHYIYTIGALSQTLFYYLLVPVEWMNPIWVIASFLISWIVIYFLRTKRIYIPLFLIPLLLLFILSLAMSISGFAISEITFIWIEKTGSIVQDSIGIMGLNRISLLESFGFFAVTSISLVVFRRPIVIYSMIWIFAISYLFFQPQGFDLNLKIALVSGTIFSLAVLAPGTNRYGAIWMNQIVFIILIGIVVMVKYATQYQYPFFLVIFFYFVLEGLFLKYIVDTGPNK
ncbi:hypothetical protein [Leptospira sp. GIMC2001]|uniref:hypothetical protein n=1 Tax=Leptospira sp. GIMC2001 TaxID=1513297 RepID=UPI00234902F4|nr:hypothetical protein [Leptospira sp. GIMC2001]WCL48747.1 hypothetical protein O4O04_15775 [Leptospira sp. GIMC2001]